MRALFPNPGYVLLPGMFVRARIDEGTNDNVVLVPQVGVTRDASGKATTLVVGPGQQSVGAHDPGLAHLRKPIGWSTAASRTARR